MPKYFEDLTIKEMFEHHDHTYMMSDDHRYYKNGRYEADIIEQKVADNGGWTEELVNEPKIKEKKLIKTVKECKISATFFEND